jgi:hypothetical protein
MSLKFSFNKVLTTMISTCISAASDVNTHNWTCKQAMARRLFPLPTANQQTYDMPPVFLLIPSMSVECHLLLMLHIYFSPSHHFTTLASLNILPLICYAENHHVKEYVNSIHFLFLMYCSWLRTPGC